MTAAQYERNTFHVRNILISYMGNAYQAELLERAHRRNVEIKKEKNIHRSQTSGHSQPLTLSQRLAIIAHASCITYYYHHHHYDTCMYVLLRLFFVNSI